jgi:hypothetical protein
MPRKKTKSGKYRFNMDMMPREQEHLKNIVTATGAASNSEAIRRAIGIYDVLSRCAEEGYTVILRKKNGTQESILLLA